MSTTFNVVPPTNPSSRVEVNRNGTNAATLPQDRGSGTSAAGAITLNSRAGVITTEALSTAAGAVYTLTLTNRHVNADSIVHVIVDAASSAGQPCLSSVTPGSGSVVIKIQNIHASAAFNAAIKVRYLIV